MLYQYIRTIFSNGGVLSDKSLDNQDESTTLSFNMQTNDYWYVGQHYPFNNFFIQVDTANTVACSMVVEYWDGSDWELAVDVLDGTQSNGKSMARSGAVQFSPDSRYGWSCTSDTTNGPAPTELSTFTIYNVYWLRFKFTADLLAATKAKRICYSFSTHQQIDSYDTTVNQYLTSFNSTKTSWDNEIITASILVVRDLKRRGLIVHNGNILKFDDVSIPTDWKTLEIIYRNLGGDYKEKLLEAKNEYEKTISIGSYTFDKDEDAFARKGEINATSIQLVR